jgi:hypothetical protein
MTLSAGTRLGPYEIVSAVGAGGMGEVYREDDLTASSTRRLEQYHGQELIPISVLRANAGLNPAQQLAFAQERG